MENVWFDIIAVVETVKHSPKNITERSALSLEDLDSEIEKLFDPETTKDHWNTFWMDPNFRKLFPNLIFRLVSLEGPNKYSQEQKQRTFELGLTSFMERPLNSVPTGAMYKVNEQTQLWEKIINNKQVEPGQESLSRLELECIILLGLSLKNREDTIKLIIESIQHGKQDTFRKFIMNNTITIRSPFRQWVKANKLDTHNDFEWDSQVPMLGLRFVPQHIIPKEFKDINSYPPVVIDTFVEHVLNLAKGPTKGHLRYNISIFKTDVIKRLNNGDFNDYPDLRNRIQQKLNKLQSLNLLAESPKNP